MGSGLINAILDATTLIERKTRHRAINTLKRQQDIEDQTTPKEMINKRYTLVRSWSSNYQVSTQIFLQAIKYSNKSPQLEYDTCMLIALGLHSIFTWHWVWMCTSLHILTQSYDDQYEINWIKSPMPMVPTINHSLFDGTQIILGPLKLGATYLGIALVWIAGRFAIATNEVPLPTFLSIESSSIEIGLGMCHVSTFPVWVALSL